MARTKIAWLIALVGLLAYETFTLMNGTPNDTLSEAVWDISRYPLIPFGAGFLAGHLFWQRRTPCP